MDNFNYKKFLAEGKLYEETEALDRESVIDMAQMVADEFTKEDASGDEFSTYMIYKVGEVDGLNFELDTEATEKTPERDAKYGTGEGWGGIFRIKVLPNGYEIRNVEKGGLVATMDMEDGFKMLSTDESRAEMGLNETSVEETLVDEDQDMADAILNALGGEAAFEAVVRAMSTDDAKVYLGGIMRDYDIEMGEPDEIPGFEGTKDALDALSIREEEGEGEIKENKPSNKMKKSELKEMIKMAMLEDARTDAEQEGYKDGFEDAKEDVEDALKKMKVSEAEEEDVDVEKDVDVDVEDDENVDVDIEKDIEVDDEETEADIDVKASVSGESKDVEAVQGLLTKALEMSQALGDEKLEDQIGNTITYFTRAHVSRVNEIDLDIDDAANTEMEAELGLEESKENLNESVVFPMWNKIK